LTVLVEVKRFERIDKALTEVFALLDGSLPVPPGPSALKVSVGHATNQGLLLPDRHRQRLDEHTLVNPVNQLITCPLHQRNLG
jgi:hypothetical protein